MRVVMTTGGKSGSIGDIDYFRFEDATPMKSNSHR